MDDQPGSSRLHALFEAAMTDYEKKTGIALDKHPLADQLQSCDTVESITAVLCEQTQAFSEFREKDKILKPLKKALSVLHTLSSAANFGQDIGLHFPPVKAIHTGLGVMLSAVKGSIDSYDALVELLESIEHFLTRLDIYTKVTPTVAMAEMIVKILVELLSTLALGTKQIKEGRTKKIVKKLFGGEKGADAILQRLDRLTLDEARITAAETFDIVCGLFQNMRVLMDDGKASAGHVIKALEIMQELASDLNKSKHGKLQQDISTWLSPPDPWKNHYAACESRHRGSAAWFIQGSTFSEWKTSEAPSSSLWIHGKPGAGKSVFCSTIIEDVITMRKAGLASVAFFYCDFREEQKMGLRGLLSSLLAQLCHQSDRYCDILSKFYSEHTKDLRPPSDDALVGCLKELLELPGLAPVYIIVDALDECPNTSSVTSPRSKVLNLIKDLIKSQFPNLYICVTSRPEADIMDVLDPLIFRCVSLHDQSEQKRDIEKYIKSVINTHSTSKRWKAEHKELVVDVLTEKADGMFRWVDCQVVYICSCIPARILHALAELPETLDETYQRTLREINKANFEFAHRLFQFVAVATRPLHVRELAELLAFDFKTGSIPKFQEDWRLTDPVHAVLSICSSLLAIVEDGRFGKVIQFSHFSVKEFLTSARLAEASDAVLRRYHVSMTPAHTLAAQACLGILLHLDKDAMTYYSLGNWPLAEYAAEHWVDHARIEDVSLNVEDGMKQLLDPSKPHLAVCVWIHDPDPPYNKPNMFLFGKRPERPLPLLLTSLQYAAVWGLHSMVKFFITELSQNVRSESFINGGTPLHLASKYGHMKAACMLIEHGADVSAPNICGRTSLHLASQSGHVEVARMLLERGADVSAQSEYGETPLHMALVSGQIEVVRMLLERGAGLSDQNESAVTYLHTASQWGQVEVARMLLERGADLSAQNKDGQTPLHLASKSGHVKVARMLLERGADVSAQNKYGETPLHLTHPWRVEVIHILLERGADLSAQDKDGQTPLHMASKSLQFEAARMLLERGADVSAQNKDNETPLHLVLQHDAGLVEFARMLIERGADLSAQNKDGQTPLHVASKSGHFKVTCMLLERGADVSAENNDKETPLHMALQWSKVDVARVLLEHGADVSAQNKYGCTPLHLASQRSQIEVARMLFERGADLSAQDKNGQTALHVALKEGHFKFARMLLERGVDVSAQNKDGWTPLHVALQWGRAAIAHIILERVADVSAQDKDGWTPLHWALKSGQIEVARKLLERGADLSAQNMYGETPLHMASKWGQVAVARMLLEHGADVSAQNKYRETPLHMALRSGEIEVARMLLEHGGDVSAQNKLGETPLYLASQRGQVEVACMLLERGGDVSAQNKDGWAPLHMALKEGHFDVARMLIERGADVSAQNNFWETPLHLASQLGGVEVACLLLERGADVSAQNKDGWAPLHLALKRGEIWRGGELARVLLERGADVLAQNKDKETSLHLALQSRQVEFALKLLERGADVLAQDKDGWTPLHLASRWGAVEVTHMLIERGADVLAQNKDGRTPLHLASQWGQVEVTRMLLERGADLSAQNKDGDTPLHLASERGQVEVTRILIERGANATCQNGQGDTSLHLVSAQSTSWMAHHCARVAEMLLKHGADVNARNKDGLTPYRLASQVRVGWIKSILLEHGADPALESPLFTSPAHTLVDLPPISSHPLLTTPNVAETLPELEPPSNETLTLERHRPLVFLTRQFLCSLGIVAIAVALSFLYEVSRRR